MQRNWHSAGVRWGPCALLEGRHEPDPMAAFRWTAPHHEVSDTKDIRHLLQRRCRQCYLRKIGARKSHGRSRGGSRVSTHLPARGVRDIFPVRLRCAASHVSRSLRGSVQELLFTTGWTQPTFASRGPSSDVRVNGPTRVPVNERTPVYMRLQGALGTEPGLKVLAFSSKLRHPVPLAVRATDRNAT